MGRAFRYPGRGAAARREDSVTVSPTRASAMVLMPQVK